MKLSKWHGLGNDYLLVERDELAAPLTPEQVRRICDYHFGVGSDGILEVVSADGDRAELVIWNPDGSTAELSGNGTRIAARWLARRSGADEVRIVVGPREVVATMRDGAEVEMDMGAVEVGETETIRVNGEDVELTPVSVGNPHAVIRRDPDRAELLRLGPLVEAHERFPQRTNVQLVRVGRDARSRRRRLGARCGGDAVLGHERRRGQRGRRCERLVREPGDGAPRRREPPGRARGRPRAPDRAGRGDLPRRALAGVRAVRFARRLDAVPPYLFAELERKLTEKQREGVDVISLGIGDPDLPTPEPVVEALIAAARDAATHQYPTNHGSQELREAAAGFYRDRFGVELDPVAEVVPALGGKEAVGHVALALLDPGDVALAPDPGYPPYTSGPLFAGAELHYLPLSRGERLPARPGRDPGGPPRARERPLSQLPEQPDRGRDATRLLRAGGRLRPRQ